ncbi:MAG: SRPBCC domain-containing protein [Novosphingobium sp.]
MLRKSIRQALAAAVLVQAGPALAEVKEMTDAGFVIRMTEEVTASPEDSWKALISPADWWSGEHTYSGDAKNLYIDAQATGCFCEKLPRPKDAPEDQRNGSVEHLHVVYSQPNRVLRLTGGLGPLQSEALHGTLTMTLKPVPGGTRILWEYVVGGFMRYKKEQIAPLVDKVLAEQLKRLGAKLGSKAPVEGAATPTPAEKGGAEAPAAGGDVAADFDASIKAPAKPKAKAPVKPTAKKPAAN